MHSANGHTASGEKITIRPLRKADLPEAEHIFRLAFGTLLGLSDPADYASGCETLSPRFRQNPDGIFVAEAEGHIVGSSLASRRGTMGLFGPVTVHPDLWNQGIGQLLVAACMETFSRWGCTHMELFTFPQSTKNVALYQKFGFWPRFLTALMLKRIAPASVPPFTPPLLSSLTAMEQSTCLTGCRDLAEDIYPGLDLREDILNTRRLRLGETVIIRSHGRVDAFALCHLGHSDISRGHACCDVRFGAVRPGPEALANFRALLGACESLALSRNLTHLTAGISTARLEAYQCMLDTGFRTTSQCLGMSHLNHEGYSRPGCFILDDWK